MTLTCRKSAPGASPLWWPDASHDTSVPPLRALQLLPRRNRWQCRSPRYEPELACATCAPNAATASSPVHFADFHMLGIALGVAALIIVISVMNGFSNELRERHAGRHRACR